MSDTYKHFKTVREQHLDSYGIVALNIIEATLHQKEAELAEAIEHLNAMRPALDAALAKAKGDSTA